jgi:hypothetical protein
MAASLALIGAAPAKQASTAFISCPIVQDTKSVPCWLAENKGELYYLGIQTDVSADFVPPSLGHRVLVEGVKTDAPRICGGIVLQSVKVSVMQASDPGCNRMLTAEDRYDLPFEPPRPPGPSNGRLAFGNGPRPSPPQPPFKQTAFDITYEFDGTVGFQHPRMIRPAIEFARLSKARHIAITGYRGATRLDDGSLAIEQEAIGRRRAEEIASLLRGVGITWATYEIADKAKYEVGDWTKRRVTVVVTP